MSNFISTHFVYDGVMSEDMGIYMIKTSGGLFEGQFWGDREIISETVQGNHTPYIYGDKISPLKFSVMLSPMEEQWTSELKNKVSRWLNNGKFNRFYTTDDISRIYYISYVGSPTLAQSGTFHGYIEVEFLNIDCYVRSPEYKKIFNLSSNAENLISLNNSGEIIYPKMYIEKIGKGDLTIINLTDHGNEFKFTNLENGEVVLIDNGERHIETNIPDKLIYDSFNKRYLRLVFGENRLLIKGKCKLGFEYQYKFLSM